MKLIIIFLLLNSSFLISQELSVSKTIDYINSTLGESEKSLNRTSLGVTTGSILKLEMGGKLTFRRMTFPYETIVETNVNDIIFEKKGNQGYGLSIKGICAENDQCIFAENRFFKNTSNENSFYIHTNRKVVYDKIFNALKYLKYKTSQDSKYGRQQDYDPFASKNFETGIGKIIGDPSKDQIDLISERNVYYLDIEICGLNQKFALDSGASMVMINEELEIKLIEKGRIRKDDYLEPAFYQIADGSIVEFRSVKISDFKIGAYSIQNLIVIVGNRDAPLLLGKNALDIFNRWSIDNENNVLILEK